MLKRSVLFSFIYLFLGCTPPNPEPLWIHQQAQNIDYWYGIGLVMKSDGIDYREKAQQKALDEIGSQISIYISSEMTSEIQEINGRIDEFTDYMIQSRMETFLPEVEFLETYSSKDHFYFRARLNKTQYYAELEKRRQNAIQTVEQYFANEETTSFVDALDYYKEAWFEMKPFLDSPFYIESPLGSGNKKNGVALIKSIVKNRINDIQISVDPPAINMILFLDEITRVSVTCVDLKRNEKIPELSLIFKSSLPGFEQEIITNDEGIASVQLGRISAKPQSINGMIHLKKFKTLSDIAFFNSLSEKNTSIELNLESPKIYLETEEINLGNKISDLIVTPNLKSLLAEKMSAVFVDQEKTADIKIMLDVRTSIKSKQINSNYPMIVYANGNLNFINVKTEESYFNFALQNIKGADFSSYNIAGIRSLEKISKALNKIFMEKLDTFYVKNETKLNY
jgi:hypothetical protein